MPQPRERTEAIIIVDDDPQFGVLVEHWLHTFPYQTQLYASGEECLNDLDSVLPVAVCLDLHLPDTNGHQLLSKLKTQLPLLPVIMLTADTEVSSAVSAIQSGAYDYLTKPIDQAKFLTTLKNAIDHYRLSLRLSQLERESGGNGHTGLLGNSAPMHQMYGQIDRIAASDITVLIHGESGSGKEIVAQTIHAASHRKAGSFIALNCAAIAESLQESELFGHEKGSFTGAIQRRIGKFELAHEGTLFLDEVAELSPAVQAKLLRVLQERTITRLGGTKEVETDFRLLAASHKDLHAEVQAGRFREDLYFRLAVFELEVPPLRERAEDIVMLANHFLHEFCKKFQRHSLRLAPETIEALQNFSWPGNIRELQNYMQRAAISATSDFVRLADLPERLRIARTAVTATPLAPAIPITQTDLATGQEIPPSVTQVSSNGMPASLDLEELENWAITTAIKRHNGNLSEVGRALGIGRTTLYRRLKKLNSHLIKDH